jgi:hypothetical protein
MDYKLPEPTKRTANPLKKKIIFRPRNLLTLCQRVLSGGGDRSQLSKRPKKGQKKGQKRAKKWAKKRAKKRAKNPPRFVPKRYLHNKKYETLDILLNQWAASSV